MERHCSLFAYFKNRNKNVKTFLKGKKIKLLLTCYNLVKVLSNFVPGVVFVKIIFSCLNIKPAMDFYLKTCLRFLI